MLKHFLFNSPWIKNCFAKFLTDRMFAIWNSVIYSSSAFRASIIILFPIRLLYLFAIYQGSISPALGVKRKCASRHHLAQIDAIQFHKENWAQLNWCIGLENTPNFHTVCSAPYASKFSVNLLAQKLLVKWWWNWLLTYQFLSPSRS